MRQNGAALALAWLCGGGAQAAKDAIRF